MDSTWEYVDGEVTALELQVPDLFLANDGYYRLLSSASDDWFQGWPHLRRSDGAAFFVPIKFSFGPVHKDTDDARATILYFDERIVLSISWNGWAGIFSPHSPHFYGFRASAVPPGLSLHTGHGDRSWVSGKPRTGNLPPQVFDTICKAILEAWPKWPPQAKSSVTPSPEIDDPRLLEGWITLPHRSRVFPNHNLGAPAGYDLNNYTKYDWLHKWAARKSGRTTKSPVRQAKPLNVVASRGFVVEEPLPAESFFKAVMQKDTFERWWFRTVVYAIALIAVIMLNVSVAG